MWEYGDIKIFLQKAMFQIDLDRFLWLKKLKTLCQGHMLLVILAEIVGMFYKKELQKTNQKHLRVEKVIKRKCNKLC